MSVKYGSAFKLLDLKWIFTCMTEFMLLWSTLRVLLPQPEKVQSPGSIPFSRAFQMLCFCADTLAWMTETSEPRVTCGTACGPALENSVAAH